MGSVISRLEVAAGYGSVNLGRRQINVPQQFLHCSQVGTTFEKMSGKRMPEGMRECSEAGFGHTAHSPRIEWRPPDPDPQCVTGCGAGEAIPCPDEISIQPGSGRSGQWHHPLPTSFASHPDQIHPLDVGYPQRRQL
jgi:hypothetical protein